MTSSKDPFSAYAQLETSSGKLGYYRLDALRGAGVELAQLPYTIRILLESLLRNYDGFAVTEEDLAFKEKFIAGCEACHIPYREVSVKQALALELYATGNSDAMYLAGLIADGSKMTRQQLDQWATGATWHLIAGCSVAWVAAEHPQAVEVAEKWIGSPKELVATAGWSTLGAIAATSPDDQLPITKLGGLLERCAKTIKQAPNRVRHAMNSFIIWRGGAVKNFEMRVQVKITNGGNSGLQYRSAVLPDVGPYVMTGYQCDVVPNRNDYNGMLYEERGRRILAHTGEKVVVDASGQPWVVGKTGGITTFNTEQWHDYRVLVVGNHHQHWIDGVLTADVVDHDEKGRRLEGLVGVQVHVGPPMKVQFKNWRIKTLPEAKLIKPEQTPIPPDAPKVAPQVSAPRKSN